MAERVLIFGATSAIAQEIAQIYARRGARLYLVGRHRGRLEAAATALSNLLVDPHATTGLAPTAARPVPVVGTHAADLAETALAPTLVATAIAALGGLDVAIIAHGFLGDQRGTERDFHQADEVITTNFLSVVALLIPLANHLESAKGGHLAVLSSVAGERGRPRNYTYGAAKAALNVYLQGLRSRLGGAGVGVHTMKLGPVDTPMTAGHKKNLLFARAPRVAAAIVRAIDTGRGETYVPWFWWGIMIVVRWLPEIFFRRIRALSAR